MACAGCHSQRQVQTQAHEVRMATMESESRAASRLNVTLHEVEVVALRPDGDTVLLRAARADIVRDDTVAKAVHATTASEATASHSGSSRTDSPTIWPTCVLLIIIASVVIMRFMSKNS